MLSFIVLAILPLALARPFDFLFFKSNDDHAPALERRYQHLSEKPYPNSTLTDTVSRIDATQIFPTSAVLTSVSPTGSAIAYPTATGYVKRDVEKRYSSFPSSPTAYPTASGFSFSSGTPTGFSSPGGPSSVQTDNAVASVKVEARKFGGPRKRNERYFYPYRRDSGASLAPIGPPTSASTAAPTFTAPTASGFPFPTGIF